MRANGLAGLVLAASLLVSVSAAKADGDPPVLAPEVRPMEAAGSFDMDSKTRQSLSGIACPDQGPKVRCLAVFDEGAEARYAEIAASGYRADPERIQLIEGGGELDAEGATAGPGHTATGELRTFYYVTGSHSVNRKTCNSNPASRHVIRFALDPQTGKAMRGPDGSLADLGDTGRLWSLMSTVPELASFVGDRKCLGTEPPEKKPQLKGQRGVNIEGLALKGGKLFFGFRGPAQAALSEILQVDADALFNGGDPDTKLTTVVVGERRGIRDLASVKDGILLLAGPDDDEASRDRGWVISFWDPNATAPAAAADPAGGAKTPVAPKELARLDLSGVRRPECDDKEIKPEAMAVLEDEPDHFLVAVLSDGMCDGGPMLFRVAR